MFQSLDIDLNASSDQTFSSWDSGWRSVLLRTSTSRAIVDELILPPVDEQLILLVTRGMSDIESRSGGGWRTARYVPGQIAMTAPGLSSRLRWRVVSADRHETLKLHMPAATIRRAVEDLWDRDPSVMRLPDALSTRDTLLAQTMLDLFRAAKEGVPDLYAETAADFIALHMLVRHGGLPPPRDFGGDDDRIRRARSFLRENLHLPLTVADIAGEAGMSRFHFLRVFRQQTGETPHRYLVRLRVERARHELKHGNATIAEVAVTCGFASRTHLATAFRRQTGLSPSDYRRLQRM